MATDILTETRLSPSQAAGTLDVSVGTVWRWLLKGVKGHKLESAIIGGRRFTSQESLSRFVAKLNAGPGETPQVRTPKQRERAVSQAEAELMRAGA
jgi:hypothetical protein